MKKIHEISSTIDKVIETINPLDTNKILFFHEPDSYIEKLNSLLLIIKKTNIFDIESEIWECYKELKNEKATVEYFDSNLSVMLSWKQNIDDVSDIIQAVNTDISTLSTKMYYYTITPMQVSTIKKQYLDIAIILFNIKQNYLEIKKNLTNRINLNKTNAEISNTQRILFPFALKPEKQEEVALYMNSIIENGYFENSNPEKQYLKIDILNAVGYIFSCKLPECQPEQIMVQSSSTASNTVAIEPATPTLVTNETETYPISSFLLHANKHLLAHKLKEVFHAEKGKSIRLLMKALEENQPALLCIGNRQFKSIYYALHDYFKRDIGSYQSVKGYVYNEIADKDDYQAIKQKLNHILSELSN